jgi:uncharacterized protein YidB (DUF937 family)
LTITIPTPWQGSANPIGQGDVAKSWIGSGPNKAISPDDLANALGADRINDLMSYSGMSREDLLNGLSRQLPNAVDKLTPDDVCRPNRKLPARSEPRNRQRWDRDRASG